jgi:hypothetical protein
VFCQLCFEGGLSWAVKNLDVHFDSVVRRLHPEGISAISRWSSVASVTPGPRDERDRSHDELAATPPIRRGKLAVVAIYPGVVVARLRLAIRTPG